MRPLSMKPDAVAKRDYVKRRYLNGGPLRVDSIGARRRLQALMCNGWTLQEMAHRLGITARQPLWQIIHASRGDTITVGMHQRICRLFDELWDKEADCPRANYARAVAQRNSYAPALAWDMDEIDHPLAQPQGIPGYPVLEDDEEAA